MDKARGLGSAGATALRMGLLALTLCMAVSLVPIAAFADVRTEGGIVASLDSSGITEAMFDVDVSDELWAGETVTKSISGKDGIKALAEGIDYKVAYEGNDRPGLATVTITGIGDYAGALTYNFLIFYDDIPASSFSEWYYGSAYVAAALGIMSGYDTDWCFGVGDPILRQDVVTMFWRYERSDEYAAYSEDVQLATRNETGLPDVEDGQYYTAAVNWAVEEGIVTGYTEDEDAGKFGVGDTMTFEQLVTVLVRMGLGGEAAAAYGTTALYSGSYADAGQVSNWACGAMSWAIDNGIVGVDTAELLPLSDVERERVATVLARYIGMVDGLDIDDMQLALRLAGARSHYAAQLAQLDSDFESDPRLSGSQSDMNVCSAEYRSQYDALVEEMYSFLSGVLDGNALEGLQSSQSSWEAEKEAAVNEAGEMYVGGSMRPLAMNTEAIECDRERIGELLDVMG